jgi:hypothetical protein
MQRNDMTRRAPSLLVLPLLALGACTQFPALDATITPELEAAPYPDLVPLEPLLARAQAGQSDPVAVRSDLEGRLGRLRARAAGLRGSVLTGRERQRLEEGLR